jgi:hypothetical protein
MNNESDFRTGKGQGGTLPARHDYSDVLSNGTAVAEQSATVRGC